MVPLRRLPRAPPSPSPPLDTMATLLKRLSLNLERRSVGNRDDAGLPASARAGMGNSPSFNDFSMHIGQEGEC